MNIRYAASESRSEMPEKKRAETFTALSYFPGIKKRKRPPITGDKSIIDKIGIVII
jgi:hypothetical protein